jgi:DNA-binding CsgD family transcriptional regulator
MLVRYDSRATGLSQRDTIDFSLDAQIRDLGAVIDRLQLPAFGLFAQFYAGPVAIRYAVERPERVSHLILWHSFGRAADYAQTAQTQGLLALLEHDWELFTETFAHARRGWAAGESARRFAQFVREAVTPEALRAALLSPSGEIGGHDVTDLLPKVQAPTLVLHRRDFLPSSGVAGDASRALDIPRRLAASIPNARLALLDGDTGPPWAGETETVLHTIDDFLQETLQPASAREEVAPSPRDVLSPRETEVLSLLARGRSNKEMADELVLSVHTVERHVANIYRKIGVRGRAQATAYALTHKLS